MSTLFNPANAAFSGRIGKESTQEHHLRPSRNFINIFLLFLRAEKRGTSLHQSAEAALRQEYTAIYCSKLCTLYGVNFNDFRKNDALKVRQNKLSSGSLSKMRVHRQLEKKISEEDSE